MKQVLGDLRKMRRPRTLIRAARILAGSQPGSDCAAAGETAAAERRRRLFVRLLDAEQSCEQERLRRDADYSIRAHIEALAALMLAARPVKARPAG